MRHAKLPLNPDAVKAADQALFKNHPELNGRKLTMAPEDGALRKEWMDSYLAASGGPAPPSAPTSPPAAPTTPCPPTPPPPPAPPAPTSITELSKSTPKLDKLPDKIAIPKEVCKKMQEQWDKSLSDKNISKEHGGTLALDKDGDMDLINTDEGKSASFQPNTKVPKDNTYVGTFHTHPYGKNDGAWNGANTTFSGGDLGTLDDFKEKISIVQSGKHKYVMVKTDKSTDPIDDAKVEKSYKTVFDKEYAAQLKAGKKAPQAAEIASDKAAAAVAKELNYGYYSGDDCSSLSRISP